MMERFQVLFRVMVTQFCTIIKLQQTEPLGPMHFIVCKALVQSEEKSTGSRARQGYTSHLCLSVYVAWGKLLNASERKHWTIMKHLHRVVWIELDNESTQFSKDSIIMLANNPMHCEKYKCGFGVDKIIGTFCKSHLIYLR